MPSIGNTEVTNTLKKWVGYIFSTQKPMRLSANLKQSYQIISLLNEAKCWYKQYPVITAFVQRPGVITYVRNYIISGVF